MTRGFRFLLCAIAVAASATLVVVPSGSTEAALGDAERASLPHGMSWDEGCGDLVRGPREELRPRDERHTGTWDAGSQSCSGAPTDC